MVATCARATAGNPFYLRELLHEISEKLDVGKPIDAARSGSRPLLLSREA